jgi:hypothetical protein
MSDLWTTALQLVGRWEGPATGRPGTGHQAREYKLILRGRFILGTNETRWEPSTEEPKGLLHEDLSVLGLDPVAAQLVMHGFYSEGLAHPYRSTEIAADGSRLVFEANQVEGGPPGMRARETLVFDGTDTLESTFELAMPGGNFEPYTHQQLTRTNG